MVINEMKVLHLLVSGYGRVGRAFVSLLQEKRQTLIDHYNLDIKVSAIVDIDGAATSPLDREIPLDYLLTNLPHGAFPSKLRRFGKPGISTVDVIASKIADVLVEATPTNINNGEPGLTNIFSALEADMHVVTAVKGPLVLEFDWLKKKALEHNVCLRLSAATAAALPALDTGTYCIAGSSISFIEGILNGTTNFILTRMQHSGETYADALREAQRLGIAETDPSLDVEGWDSAVKLILIANTVLGSQLKLNDVKVSGITNLSGEDIKLASESKQTLKLIARAEVLDGAIRASVDVRPLPHTHPLAHVNGAEKGITYHTDSMGRITVIGGKSDPKGAAAALLKDIIHLSREQFPF